MSAKAKNVLEKKVLEKAKHHCIDEYTDYSIYSSLAARETDPKRKRILQELAKDEEKHYLFWKKLVGECFTASSKRWLRAKVSVIASLYKLLGPMFTLKLLERGEEKTIQEYREIMAYIPSPAREELRTIISDEERHEKALLDEIEDIRQRYLGYVALGLADALVEITGVHAGFLGATSRTLMAGIAGLVVGFSAALSMAGAAYLQAKHSEQENPLLSALITGLSYIISVSLLAFPYFIVDTMILAFAASVAVAVLLSSMFTYYSVVVQDKVYIRELVENLSLLLGTAIGSYVFGKFLGELAGIQTL